MKNSLRLLFFLVAVATAAAAGERSTPSDWDVDAAFPKTPTTASMTQQTALGPLKETVVAVEDGGKLFAIVEVELPRRVPDNVLPLFYETMMGSMMAARKGVLLTKETTALANHEALRFVVEIADENKRADWRVVLIGQKLYQFAYEAPSDRFSPDVAQAFYHSVRQIASVSNSPAPSVWDRNAAAPVDPGTVASDNFTPKDWSIEAVFPAPASIQSSETPSPAGPVKETHLSLVQGEVIFSIVRVSFPAPLPADKVKALFESGKGTVLRNGKGALQREEKVTIAGEESRRYVVDYTHEFNVTDYRIDYRFVMIDQAFYTLAYRAPLTIYSTDQARTFFRSVKRRTK